jgi:hypothetical protein
MVITSITINPWMSPRSLAVICISGTLLVLTGTFVTVYLPVIDPFQNRPSSSSSAITPVIAQWPAGPGDVWPLSEPMWSPKKLPRWASANWSRNSPLNQDDLARSFNAPTSPEAWCPWARVALALDHGEPVDAIVIGGSVTLGATCGNAACAWPGPLAEWLARVRPFWRLTVRNLAQHAMGAAEWVHNPIPQLSEWRPDIIIIDTSANAFFYKNESLQISMDRLLWRLLRTPGRHTGQGPPAVLYIQTFRTCGTRGCQVCPEPGVKLGKGESPPYYWCPWFWAAGSVEAAVAHHYGLAVASYRDAVWPVQADPPADLPLLWQASPGDMSGLHPTVIAHELIADVVKYALARLLMGWPHPPTAHENRSSAASNSTGSVATDITLILGGSPSCQFPCQPDAAVMSPACDCSAVQPPSVPYTSPAMVVPTCATAPEALLLGPDNPATFVPVAQSGDWELVSEKPGRPAGWSGVIRGNGGAASWIAVPVFFKLWSDLSYVFPQIELTFLRGYEGFGDADVGIVELPGCSPLAAREVGSAAAGRSLVVRGMWQSPLRRVTVPVTATWAAVGEEPGSSGANPDTESARFAISPSCRIKGDTRYTLNITLLRAVSSDKGTSSGDQRFKVMGVSSCGMFKPREHGCCR